MRDVGVRILDQDQAGFRRTNFRNGSSNRAWDIRAPRDGGLRVGVAVRDDLNKIGVDEQHRVLKYEGCDFRLVAGERVDNRWRRIGAVGETVGERVTHQRRRIVEQHQHRAFGGGAVVF